VVAYRLVIARSVADRIRNLPPDLKHRIREALRAIGGDPVRGEPLKRELDAYRKYKVRRYRIIYQVDRAKKTVRIVALGHRRTIYEEATDLIRSGG